MKIIDLINYVEVKFEISSFPDGQQLLTLHNTLSSDRYEITSRIETFRDLELIIQANQILRENKAKEINLIIPYFLGARSDRKFSYNQTNYLKNVICQR